MVGVENRSGRWAHHHWHRQILQQTSRLGNVSESSGDKSRPDQRNDLHARRWCGGDCRRADRSQPWTKFGSYIVMLWLIGIAVNLLTTGMFYDLAMRDVQIAVSAFALSQLTAVREQHATAQQGAKAVVTSQLSLTR
jgi:hypothetical protein